MLKRLMIDGGPGMWLILLFGVLSLGTAAWFAWRVEGRVRGFLDQMSRAVACAALASAAIDLARVCEVVGGKAGTFGDKMRGGGSLGDFRWILLVVGLGESLAPLVMGFAFLALVHFFTAIGQRRLDARRS